MNKCLCILLLKVWLFPWDKFQEYNFCSKAFAQFDTYGQVFFKDFVLFCFIERLKTECLEFVLNVLYIHI